MIKGNLLLGLLCIAFYNSFFFLLCMKGTSYENLEQIFSALLLACAVVFFVMIGSILLSTCLSYLFELDGYPIIQCFGTVGFVSMHCGFPAATSRGSKTQT